MVPGGAATLMEEVEAKLELEYVAEGGGGVLGGGVDAAEDAEEVEDLMESYEEVGMVRGLVIRLGRLKMLDAKCASISVLFMIQKRDQRTE